MKRSGNYDFLRILSCFAVIVIHVNAQFYLGRMNPASNDTYYIIESILNLATRFSVPAFVMISGAFILRDERNGDLFYFYRKMLHKIISPFLISSLILLVITETRILLYGGDSIAAVKKWLSGDFYNLWYMYMLMGLYFLAPFLVKLKYSISKKDFVFLASILMIWACISQVFSSFSSMTSLGFVAAYVPYFMFGSILYETTRKRGHAILYALLSIFTVSLTWFVRRAFNISLYEVSAFCSFFSPGTVLYSFSVFCFFGSIKTSVNITRLASMTFYIYLFHTIIYQTVLPFFKLDELIIIPLVSLLTFMIGYVLSIFYSILFYA